MDKFERIGVNRQYNCTTTQEAVQEFTRSCDCCCHCSRALWHDCDRCVIAHIHEAMVAYFADKDAKNRKEAKYNGKSTK